MPIISAQCQQSSQLRCKTCARIHDVYLDRAYFSAENEEILTQGHFQQACAGKPS